LTVQYTVGGMAVAGTDYAAPSGTLTIAAGDSRNTLIVSPFADDPLTANQTVVVTLAPNAAYLVGSAASDTVTIAPTLPTVSVTASQANG
jgi:hypothetical protein